MRHSKVLILTPNWPPVAYPDLHRVRIALGYFSKFGWEPHILRVNPNEQVGTKDELLSQSLPKDVKTWQSGFIKRQWTKWFGMNSVGLRSFFHLATLGSKIAKEESIDLVFISTTMFPLMLLGIYWKFLHRVPYVLDFQDPWVNNYCSNSKNSASWKSKISNLLAKFLEPLCLRFASFVVSVSPSYIDDFSSRYLWFDSSKAKVLPFAAFEGDLEVAQTPEVTNPIFSPGGKSKNWVCVGRGGKDMAFTQSALFLALSNCKTLYQSVKIYFIGTNYSPETGNLRSIEQLANQFSLKGSVQEISTRIPYFEALKCLIDADLLLILGSDDPGYSPSKIYPYVLSRKPLLAVLHEKSNASNILAESNINPITFHSESAINDISEQIVQKLMSLDLYQPPKIEWRSFGKYSAENMTKELCTVFDVCMKTEKISEYSEKC